VRGSRCGLSWRPSAARVRRQLARGGRDRRSACNAVPSCRSTIRRSPGARSRRAQPRALNIQCTKGEPRRLVGYLSMPEDALPPVMQMLIAERFKYAVLYALAEMLCSPLRVHGPARRGGLSRRRVSRGRPRELLPLKRGAREMATGWLPVSIFTPPALHIQCPARQALSPMWPPLAGSA